MLLFFLYSQKSSSSFFFRLFHISDCHFNKHNFCNKCMYWQTVWRQYIGKHVVAFQVLTCHIESKSFFFLSPLLHFHWKEAFLTTDSIAGNRDKSCIMHRRELIRLTPLACSSLLPFALTKDQPTYKDIGPGHVSG